MSELDAIRRLRVENNEYWMKIVEIALRHAPDEVKPIMREIGLRDAAVTALWSKLAK
jgi:hypothetical protein